MQNYEYALKDIKSSLALGYPKDMQYKIKERRARCLLAQENFPEALTAFK